MGATTANASFPGPGDVTAAPWTPSIATSGTDGTVEQVRQLVQCGTNMYAVGKFSSIAQGGQTVTRNNAFSFDATTGTITGWDPNVNGQVNSIALSGDCLTAYLGGTFTAINGVTVKNIAAVSTSNGSVQPLTTFAHNASGKVNTVTLTHGHLLVGGNFTAINGSTKDYMVSLDPTTGKDDGYVNLNISGKYTYTDQGGKPSGNNSTNVYNTSLSPDSSKLLVMGVFTTVSSATPNRRQIFMLDLGSSSATLDPWYSPEFNQNCAVVEPFWLQDASWSPDGSTVYIATTGYKPASDIDYAPYVTSGYYTQEPRGGLCDAAAAFPSNGTSVTHKWVNYTGCDSLYSTAADLNHVYVGGHERFANNKYGCDTYLAPGATRVDAPGMAGLSPVDGTINYNPTRSRGLGADDMLRIFAPSPNPGLWIASDNSKIADKCAGESGHAGICFISAGQL